MGIDRNSECYREGKMVSDMSSFFTSHIKDNQQKRLAEIKAKAAIKQVSTKVIKPTIPNDDAEKYFSLHTEKPEHNHHQKLPQSTSSAFATIIICLLVVGVFSLLSLAA